MEPMKDLPRDLRPVAQDTIDQLNDGVKLWGFAQTAMYSIVWRHDDDAPLDEHTINDVY